MQTEEQIVVIKTQRKELDEHIQEVRALPPSREVSLVITKLQEAVMWLGMELKRINEASGNTIMPNPYPNSKDPSNTKIDKTADGLKL